MPAGTSPFKEGTNASGALRLEMCRCFAALAQEPGMPPLEVSGWEVAQAAAGSRNYTVLTLEMLARENPGAILYLAIGSDMLLSFEGSMEQRIWISIRINSSRTVEMFF